MQRDQTSPRRPSALAFPRDFFLTHWGVPELAWVGALLCFIFLCFLPPAAVAENPPSQENNAVPEAVPPPESDTTATPASQGQRISMSLRDADLVEVLRSFAKIGNFNLILDPAVRGKVTVELRDVPWEKALEQILKAQGLGVDVVGGHRLIGSPSAVARQRDQLLAMRRIELRLEHLDAVKVAAVLGLTENGFLSPLGSVQALDRQGLVLADTGLQLLQLGPLLQQLDRPEAAHDDLDALQRRAQLAWERRLDAPKP